MSATDDERLTGLAASLARDDPRFVRSLDEGRPAPPREYRRLRGWSWLAVATAALIAGVVLPHCLLLAAGLVWRASPPSSSTLTCRALAGGGPAVETPRSRRRGRGRRRAAGRRLLGSGGLSTGEVR
ncbi:DUF3040 domain-containing protein [Streptomyces bobili]